MRSINDFFNNEFTQYSVNNAYQSLGCFVDGMKPTQRKVIWTVKKNNIKSKTKVDAIANMTANETQYLGGSQNIEGVIVNIAKSYTGSNNLPLLQSYGDFGIRQNPVSAASRYIYVSKSHLFDSIIHKEDDPLLEIQVMEGPIEPKLFYPIVPLILINGSEGIGTGFSQKILSRNPMDIIKYLISTLEGKKSRYKFIPYWNSFKGNIEKTDKDNQWQIKGCLEIKNTTTVLITELPISYTLKGYTKILDKLEESKIIQSYKDKSNPKTDEYLFEIKFKRENLSKYSEDQLYDVLKLTTTITENITCIGDDYNILIFNSIEELMKQWFNIRLKKYQERKDIEINALKSEINVLSNKIRFIEGIINDTIKIFKKSKKEVQTILKELNFDTINGSYDYLLQTSIYNTTKEKIEELQNTMKTKQNELKILEETSIEKLWIDDLKQLEKELKKIKK